MLENSAATTRIGRRALAKGVAWSAPAVLASTALPAFAASCYLYTVDWTTLSNGTATAYSTNPGAGGRNVTVGVSSTTAGKFGVAGAVSSSTPVSKTAMKLTTSFAGTSGQQTATGYYVPTTDYRLLTLTFPKATQSLSLAINSVTPAGFMTPAYQLSADGTPVRPTSTTATADTQTYNGGVPAPTFGYGSTTGTSTSSYSGMTATTLTLKMYNGYNAAVTSYPGNYAMQLGTVSFQACV